MDYFFPNLLTVADFALLKSKSLGTADFSLSRAITVDSGESALCLLLRSFNLPAGSSVAIPAFVCEAVPRAVKREGLIPLPLDLKREENFWSDYDSVLLLKHRVAAVVLVHLYGYQHPDTPKIVAFCAQNQIKLIQDAAQCYGTMGSGDDVHWFEQGDGLIYSFGPGKSSSAAFGGLILLTQKLEQKKIVLAPVGFFCRRLTDLKARLFLQSRIYGHGKVSGDQFQDRVLGKLMSWVCGVADIRPMTAYQKRAAELVMQKVEEARQPRQERFETIATALLKHPKISVAYHHPQGIPFKVVLLIDKDQNPDDFCEHLLLHNIPYARLFEEQEDLQVESPEPLERFQNRARRIVEISCEATIPLNDIQRVATVLKNY